MTYSALGGALSNIFDHLGAVETICKQATNEHSKQLLSHSQLTWSTNYYHLWHLASRIVTKTPSKCTLKAQFSKLIYYICYETQKASMFLVVIIKWPRIASSCPGQDSINT